MPRPTDRHPRRLSDPPSADYRVHRVADDRRRDNGEMELRTPFGFSGRLSSANFASTLVIVGLMLAISVIGYFMWDSQVKGFDTLNRTLQVQTGILSQYSADLKYARERGEREHADIARAFSDVAYIISVPQDKREKLGLEEPSGLRKRLRGE